MDVSEPLDEAIPAATLVLLRERPGGPPDLLMLERAGGMAFAAGALVFPGGRVDPGDHALAADPSLAGPQEDREEAAARIAAIRETIEEVGIAIGLAPAPDAAALAGLRAALAAGEDFAGLLRAGGWRLDLAALVPFARWRPNFREARRFDARFYLARASGADVARADGGESVRALWTTASDALADADAGRHHIIFPTRRNLERLAGFASFEAACADAARFPVETITPWIEERAGERWLCIPDDRGYPVTAEPLATARRGLPPAFNPPPRP